ncbi:hypothetical protein ACVWWO_000019 [Bradyrhizobium sp. F1.13.1]
MSADPHALRRDVPQQGIETGAISTVLNVSPNQHAVHCEQLLPDLFGEAFVVDRRACLDAMSGESLEEVREAAVLRGGVPARGSIASRKNGHGRPGRGLTFGHAQAPLIACCAELGPRSHGESARPLGNTLCENVWTFQDDETGDCFRSPKGCPSQQRGPVKSS